MKNLLTYDGDALCFGSKSIRLANQIFPYRGPLYIYDLQVVKERFCKMQGQLAGARIFYAMKANSHPELMKLLLAEGAGADVVSGGEIQRALDCGATPRAIIFSGVGKTIAEIELAIDLEIEQINIESLPELHRVLDVAKRKNKSVRVAFRVNPDVDIKTHPYIATGLAENKFGLEMKSLGEIFDILRKNTEFLTPVGISLHLGSQMMEFDGLRNSLQKLKPLFEDLRRQFPSVNNFDAGGGLGIDYQTENGEFEEESLKEYAQVIHQELPKDCQLQLEPGRWLVARAGVLISEVQYIKETSQRTFVILDAGMNHLMRPALYQAHHRILPLLKRSGEMRKFDIVGPICESADFLAKQRLMTPVQQGDFVAIADVGAYGFTMSNLYNLRELPVEKLLE